MEAKIKQTIQLAGFDVNHSKEVPLRKQLSAIFKTCTNATKRARELYIGGGCEFCLCKTNRVQVRKNMMKTNERDIL